METTPTPFPFATLTELKARWERFPTGKDALAGTLLEDASQYILDVCPSAADASPYTRRRIVCAVVRRAMEIDALPDLAGLEQYQETAGPFSQSMRPNNPHGDFYLTKQERDALGGNKQHAFTIDMIPTPE